MNRMKIGEHIKAAREAVDISSGEAAKKIGISSMTLSRYENNHRLPDAQTLLAMTSIYSCDLSELLVGKINAFKPYQIPVKGKILDRTTFELDLEGIPQETLPILSDRKNVYAIKVIGPNLQPIYYGGDFLIMEESEKIPFMEVFGRERNAEIVTGKSLGKIIGVYRNT